MKKSLRVVRKKKVKKIWLISLIVGIIIGFLFLVEKGFTWTFIGQAIALSVFITVCLGLFIFVFVTDKYGRIKI